MNREITRMYLRLGDREHRLQGFELGGVPQEGLAPGIRRPLHLSCRRSDALELLQVLGVFLDLLLRLVREGRKRREGREAEVCLSVREGRVPGGATYGGLGSRASGCNVDL